MTTMEMSSFRSASRRAALNKIETISLRGRSNYSTTSVRAEARPAKRVVTNKVILNEWSNLEGTKLTDGLL